MINAISAADIAFIMSSSQAIVNWLNALDQSDFSWWVWCIIIGDKGTILSFHSLIPSLTLFALNKIVCSLYWDIYKEKFNRILQSGKTHGVIPREMISVSFPDGITQLYGTNIYSNYVTCKFSYPNRLIDSLRPVFRNHPTNNIRIDIII